MNEAMKDEQLTNYLNLTTGERLIYKVVFKALALLKDTGSLTMRNLYQLSYNNLKKHEMEQVVKLILEQRENLTEIPAAKKTGRPPKAKCIEVTTANPITTPDSSDLNVST